MKNSFTIEVCFGDVPLMPYEWEKTSTIMGIKVERVPTYLLRDVLTCEGYINARCGTILISDTKTSVALKLNKEGKIIKRSFLKFDDSLDVCEYAFNLKDSKLEFVKGDRKIVYPKNLTVEQEMKDYIISSIKVCKDEDLSRYLYYLYFDEVKSYSKDKLIKSIEGASLDKSLKLYKFLIES